MKKRLKILFSMMIVLLFFAYGCSSNNDKGSGGSKNQSATKVNNEIIVAIDQNFITLDPHEAGDTVSIFGIRSMYEGLVGFDEHMNIEPVLAESFEISEDAKEYVFNLKEGITFHDGEPFNAEAVKANFDRIIDGELRAVRNLKFLDSIEVLDEYKIKFTLNQPFGPMINKFAMIPIASPKAIADKNVDIALNPVGTGQFEFDVWNQGDTLSVKKYRDYWGEADNNVEKVTFKPVPENGSRVAMLKTGEADFAYPVPQNSVKDLKDSEELVIEETPSTIARYVSINTFKEPFNDAKVRQAMNYAIDKEAFLQVVKSGYGNILDSTMSSEVQYYSKQETYNFDLEKAKKLMEEAGYKDGFQAEIWGNNSSESNTGMQFIKQQLVQIGIDVEIKSMEEGTLSDEIYTPETPEDAKVQMWYVSWSPSSGDADGATRSIFHKDYFPPNGANTAYYDNDEVSEWIDAANNIADQDEQKKLYEKIQHTIYKDAPWLFLASDTILSGYKTNLEGVYVLPDGSISVTNANLK